MRSLTNPKAIVVDRWPWLLQTSIPEPLDYPVRSAVQAWWVRICFVNLTISCLNNLYRDIVSGIVGVLYADGWRESFESLQRLIDVWRRQ